MKKENFNATEYKNQFIAEKYDRINLTVPKGQKEIIKAHAEIADGGSINGFIQRAIQETMKRDKENTQSTP